MMLELFYPVSTVNLLTAQHSMRENIGVEPKITLGNIDSQELYLSPKMCKIFAHFIGDRSNSDCKVDRKRTQNGRMIKKV